MTHPLPSPASHPFDGLPPAYAACLREIAEPVRGAIVVAQLGQSLDGRIALPNGESRWINNTAALDHLHRLRASVDAVVVGIGTALADDPQLTVRRVEGRSPARVVIDRRGRCPHDARVFARDGIECAIVTTPDTVAPPGVRALRLEAAGNAFDPRDVVAALRDVGWRRILVEGGAGIVSSFVEAGVVDRLHVLVAPVLLGSGKSGLTLAPLQSLAEACRPRTTVHVLPDGDVLFDCELGDRSG